MEIEFILSVVIWSWSLPVKIIKGITKNGYNTYLYIQKMGSSLTTHPITPPIYENLYAI